MKKTLSALAGFALSISLLAACAGSTTSSSVVASQQTGSGQTSQSTALPKEEQNMQSEIYRGKVTDISDDSITVEQLEGYNYGQKSIVFHLNSDTKMEEDAPSLAKGVYVEVTYNGVLTRSMPPQGNAQSVQVLAPSSESAVVNGTIQEVTKTEQGYSLVVKPEGVTSDELQDMVVLQFPPEALEHLTLEELVAGLKICAVTRGIATMSLPPQMPVVALMPYTTTNE